MKRPMLLCILLWSACGQPSSQPDAMGPDAPVDELCDPGPIGPHWMEEGELLVVELACQTGLPLAGDRFSFDVLPPNAVYDAARARLEFRPGFNQAAMYRLSLSAAKEYGPDEVRTMTVGVADRWDTPQNVPIADPQAYTHEFGLPVLWLSPGPQTEVYGPATVLYRGIRYDIEAKLRGASSLSYPKRSYTLRFGDGARFSEPGHAGGFLDKDRVVLTSTFDDNSYIRQRLAYELWNRLNPTIEIQAYSAVVYVDGEYLGLYTVSDFINDDLMEASGLAKEGNLYKAINHDANFRLTSNQGNPKGTLHDGYEKTEGTPAQGEVGAFDDLEELVSFVATSEDAQFTQDIASRIAMDDYLSWWILVSYATAGDSAGKNSYHYRDPQDANGRFHMAPWDFNHSFGQSWTTHRVSAATVDTYENRNYLFERLLGDGTYGPLMRQRIAESLSLGALLVEQVQGTIDDYEVEINRSARRDWRKWENAYRSFNRWNNRTDFTTYEEEIAYVRAWVAEHTEALQLQYP